jgi:UDP-glucose:glycoprotein glucosyltransferase
VELALKNTDYLVVDDRAAAAASGKGESGPTRQVESGGFFDEILGEDPWAEFSTPLTKEELAGMCILAQPT